MFVLAFLVNGILSPVFLIGVPFATCSLPGSGGTTCQPVTSAPEPSNNRWAGNSPPIISQDPGLSDTQGQPAQEIVLTWHREGGIAGFCDEMKVWATGAIRTESCKTQGSRQGKLAKEDLGRFDYWRALYGAIVIETKDSPTSDAMILRLMLKGTGSRQPSDEDRTQILDWAQDVFNQNRP